jgi:glyoxylase-like metal-dependent hydrolase (beta-lactamase superfamily II)
VTVERLEGAAPFFSNCYLVRRDETSRRAVVVDPGGDPAAVLAALGLGAAGLAAILVTHTDVDHVSGVSEVAQATQAPVYAPAAEAEALRSGTTRGGFHVRPHLVDHPLEGGETLTLAGIDFEVVPVPGHSPGHLAYATEGAVFSGDLLFAGSVGRTDLDGGDFTQLLESVVRLRDRCGAEVTVYPGHGGPTTIARELASNEFLSSLRAG